MDSGIGEPCTVALSTYRHPVWPRSPHDMAGNVWEWCSTIHSSDRGEEFRYPYSADDGREELSRGDDYRRVVKGGSFTNLPFLLRSSMRGYDRPAFRTIRQGFRVVSGD